MSENNSTDYFSSLSDPFKDYLKGMKIDNNQYGLLGSDAKLGLSNSFANGLAGSGTGGSTGFIGGLSDAFTNDNGGFDLGGSINTLKQIGGLAEGLQGLFGKNPEFEQTKKIQDANLANMQRMSDNSVNAYNNQLARGAGGRSKAHGGVDPLTRAV